MTTSPSDRARILVTGARGFLASSLRERLTEEGAEVHALSRADSSGPGWWQGSLAEADAASRLFAQIRPDVVFHLAGDVGADPGVERVRPTFESLLGSTVNALAAALESGCRRVVLAASLTEPDDESGPATPASPYAAAKWAASGYGRMFQLLYGLEVVSVRPFMVYGPGQAADKLIPSVIGAFGAGEVPQLSSGRTGADWVYVDDVVDGLVAAARVPYPGPAPIDLGSGELVSIRDVVELIRELIGTEVEPRFGARPDRPFERPRVADLAAARALLGWEPRTALREGLARTIAAAAAFG